MIFNEVRDRIKILAKKYGWGDVPEKKLLYAIGEIGEVVDVMKKNPMDVEKMLWEAGDAIVYLIHFMITLDPEVDVDRVIGEIMDSLLTRDPKRWWGEKYFTTFKVRREGE